MRHLSRHECARCALDSGAGSTDIARMTLPPGFLDELRTRLPLSQVAGRKVLWDNRKSNQAKGDMWAPCPFHQEKTASFHVDDRKGFYYCFGCHAKGDAISFVRETENVGFMEAVEILAREAGLALPERDPKAAEKADRHTRLAEVMEQAVRFYRMQLSAAAAGEARDYLARRGLGAPAQGRFEIGFAPDARQALWQHLTGAGVAADEIVDAGLAARPDGGGSPYDRFRGRVIFPIRDARGRCIALGGRALRDGKYAKYLNSPDTELFDKGRALYNLAPAREAAGKGAALVVAEGYMDVIALSEAGFRATVAPLGTAITEEQLRMMWRIAPEPVIALDGDTAGLRAAMRLVDVALPMLEAGKGLRFAILPEGQDPDDLLRAEGPGAMQRLIESATPMVRLLWRRETEGRVFDSPERRAALDKALRTAILRIPDPSLRSHYGAEIKRLRDELFAPQRRARAHGRIVPGGRGRSGWTPAPMAPLPATRGTLLAASGTPQVTEHLHEAMILAICVTHPALIGEVEADLEGLEMTTRDHAALRDALLRHGGVTDRRQMRDKIAAVAGDALEKLLSLGHVAIAPPIRNADDTDFARLCLRGEIAKLAARRGVNKEVDDAVEDLDGMADEGLTWRLGQATAARHRAETTTLTDSSDLGEDRDALSNHLQSLIDGEVWIKKRR